MLEGTLVLACVELFQIYRHVLNMVVGNFRVNESLLVL
jgi:hypothetical protein